MDSINLILHYLVFTQFSESKFIFDEQRIKNTFEICENSSASNAMILLLDNSRFDDFEATLFRQYLSAYTKEERMDLKEKIQCFQHQNVNDKLKRIAIKNLGLLDDGAKIEG